jgi:hypothetical protein
LLKIEEDQKPFESDEAKSSDDESEYEEEEVTDSEEEAIPRLKPVFVQKYFCYSTFGICVELFMYVNFQERSLDHARKRTRSNATEENRTRK